MTLTSPHTADTVQKQQLRALDKEYRNYQVALNQTQASLTHTVRIAEQNYHRRRKAILANGHDHDDGAP